VSVNFEGLFQLLFVCHCLVERGLITSTEVNLYSGDIYFSKQLIFLAHKPLKFHLQLYNLQ